ncbi:MAG: molybdopterin-dependent oxidoreductase [Christensenellales bacterium]|jgi:DMSO/TMAO reductase YedYZ molybdopterin-dependent catalytic subunit
MKKSTGIKLLSGVTGAAALLSGCAASTPESAAAPEINGSAVVSQAEEVNTVEAAGLSIEARDQEVFEKVANVQGEFAFDQNVNSPTDEVFNLFGTASTYMCAKPGFAFDEVTREEYYINIGGKVKKYYTISAAELEKRRASERNMVCSCATSGTVAQAAVKGFSVADILELAELEDGVNTITFKDDQGYGLPLPLSYVLERDALLVYQIGGKDLPASQGAPMQVWMPGTVAKYFTRRVTEIELTQEDNVPEVQGVDEEHRAKVGIVNRFENSFKVGDQIRFEGYADDCGVQISAVEFSLDGGETWTVCDTSSASADKWVYWYFSYTTEKPGTFKLDVRARTADGKVSPLYSSVVFTVVDDSSL